MASSKIRVQIENRILSGLAYEWKVKFDDLPEVYRPLIRPPRFLLSDMDSRLALWSQADREMRFSRRFVFNSGWDSIRHCLWHEMAHQIACTHDESEWETHHGQLFQRICSDIHADPSASGSYPTLEDQVLDDAGNENDRLMVKVKKLLALAESPNPHEAETACAKANELIRRHNLDMIEQDRPRDFVSIFIDQPALRFPSSTSLLMSLLEDFYFVQAVWIQTWVVAKDRIGRCPEISGRRANVQIAHYVYDYIKRYTDMRWTAHRSQHKVSHHRKNSFTRGVIEGFYEKLTRQKESAAGLSPNQSKALVALEDTRLNQYIRGRYARLSARTVRAQVDPSVLSAGMAEGEKLVISKGITGNQGNKGRLIGP
ncbi:MAG: DUF2786 domain-containing protein [Deltaproteobacteria bacterium]|nr:DUF2786 domain-containing protein [Deltaproteobacteria bacterium]